MKKFLILFLLMWCLVSCGGNKTADNWQQPDEVSHQEQVASVNAEQQPTARIEVLSEDFVRPAGDEAATFFPSGANSAEQQEVLSSAEDPENL